MRQFIPGGLFNYNDTLSNGTKKNDVVTLGHSENNTLNVKYKFA